MNFRCPGIQIAQGASPLPLAGVCTFPPLYHCSCGFSLWITLAFSLPVCHQLYMQLCTEILHPSLKSSCSILFMKEPSLTPSFPITNSPLYPIASHLPFHVSFFDLFCPKSLYSSRDSHHGCIEGFLWSGPMLYTYANDENIISSSRILRSHNIGMWQNLKVQNSMARLKLNACYTGWEQNQGRGMGKPRQKAVNSI